MRISDWSSDVCSSDLLSHRIGDEQAADIGAVSQPDFSGPQRLWRSGRRPRVFRQGRGRPQTPRNGLSRHIAEGTIQLPPGKDNEPPPAATTRGAEGNGDKGLDKKDKNEGDNKKTTGN